MQIKHFKLIRVCLAIAVVGLSPSPIQVQIEQVANVTGLTAYDIDVQNQVAYVAADTDGLQTYDVSNPAEPRKLGSIPTDYAARQVDVVDDRAYVLNSRTVEIGHTGEYTVESKIDIIDTTLLTMPVQLSSFTPLTPTADMDVVDRLAYVVGGYRLVIYDVSVPTNPTVRGSARISGYATGVQTVGNLVFVVQSHGVDILDISDPTNPLMLSTLEALGYGLKAQVVGTYVYILSNFTVYEGHGNWHYEANITSYDISDLHNPVEYRQAIARGLASAMYVADDLIFVTSTNGTPYNPILHIQQLTPRLATVGSFITSVGMAFQVVDDILYVADYTHGMQIERIRRIELNHSLYLPYVPRGATLLPNGTVFVASGFDRPPAGIVFSIASAELYDVAGALEVSFLPLVSAAK